MAYNLPVPLTTEQFTNLPYDPKAEPYFRSVNAIWPDLQNYRVTISPARNGMDRKTGKLMQGWAHVEQSIEVIFATPFHERVLRRWVGSFVPHLLGRETVPRIITRFFWAIASAIDIWEPNYRIKQVLYMGDALNKEWAPALTQASAADLIRLGRPFSGKRVCIDLVLIWAMTHPGAAVIPV